MDDDLLTPILHRLDAAQQRATYGAVAGVIGATPMFLMNGRPRNALHSWVVSGETGMPTRYLETDRHPNLLANERVVSSADELREWLG